MRDPKRHQQLSDWGFTAVRLGKDGDEETHDDIFEKWLQTV